MRTSLIVSAIALALGLLGGAARAEEADDAEAASADPNAAALEKITRLNQQALAAYEDGRYEEARDLLKQALDACDAAGLARHPIRARTHLHLGAVIASGLGSRELAVRQLAKALAIRPDIQLTPGLETPEAEAALAEARGGTAAAVARKGGDNNEGESDDADGDDDADLDGGRWLAGVQIGSGMGYARGNAEVNADSPVRGGLARAGLGHVAPELGFRASPHLVLSLQARYQWLTGLTEVVDAGGRTYRPAGGALAAFAKATWMFSGTRVRPFVTALVGGGQIRHIVTLSGLEDCGPARDATCVDSVRAGPFFAGGGGGIAVALTPRLALVASLLSELAAPRLTFNVDANIGVTFVL